MHHPDKDIRAAIEYAESKGFRLRKGRGHAWAILYCHFADRSGCRMSIWSTPRNPRAHADDIRRFVDDCPH